MRCHLCMVCCTSNLKILITHWRVFHNLTESSQYECTLPNCGRRFPSLNSFKRHFRLEHSSYFPTASIPASSSCIDAADSSSLTKTDSIDSKDSSTCALSNNSDEDITDASVPSTSTDIVKETAFSELVQFQITRMITNLYSKPSIPRNIVQCLVDEIDNIITVPLKIIEDKVLKVLTENSVHLNEQNEIGSMFSVFRSVLKENSTEYLRMKNLRNAGVYIDPTSHTIGQEFEVSEGRELPKNRCAQVVPLRLVLKAFLQTDGVLDSILQYMASLDSETTVLSHIVHGEVWKETIQHFEDKVCLPFGMFFDEYETGNTLGSHSGIHKLGGGYIMMLCIPREYRSQLKNIFLAILLHHDDHKQAGNKVSFGKLIEEFKFLAEEGILVETKTKTVRVYFVLSVIEGDNLGLNTILGYSGSFSANHYCRLCRLSKAEAQYATELLDTNMRTEFNYNADVQNEDFQSSGVKESCAFNDIPYYHCVRNIIADTFHDLLEGVLPYETGLVFHQLVLVDKVIDFGHFNSIIRNFDYQFESCTPRVVTREQLKNKFIKMSAAEMHTFFTYLPAMFGRLVPEENIYWKLLIKMRRIVSLLTSSSFDTEWLDYLDNLISEHHSEYIKLFGALKPKHHFMLHYSRIIKMMGPLEQIQGMRGEAKHREGKLTAVSVSTRVNICKTIAIKQQLILSNRLFLNKGFDSEFSSGRLTELSEETADALVNLTNFTDADDFLACDRVTIFNTQYKIDFVLWIDVGDEFPMFAQIKEILISLSSNDILFFCDGFRTAAFWEHIFAFEVIKTSKQIFIKHSDLSNPRPVLLYEHSKRMYTVTKSAV